MSSCDSYIEPDFSQAPGESVVYVIDWPNRGLPEGAAIIATSFFPIGTTPYAISNIEIIDEGQQVQFQITGGVPGTRYYITNKITINDTEIFETTLVFDCVAQNLRQRNTCL